MTAVNQENPTHCRPCRPGSHDDEERYIEWCIANIPQYWLLYATACMVSLLAALVYRQEPPLDDEESPF